VLPTTTRLTKADLMFRLDYLRARIRQRSNRSCVSFLILFVPASAACNDNLSVCTSPCIIQFTSSKPASATHDLPKLPNSYMIMPATEHHRAPLSTIEHRHSRSLASTSAYEHSRAPVLVSALEHQSVLMTFTSAGCNPGSCERSFAEGVFGDGNDWRVAITLL
jgi:hypothetical protein